MTDRLLSTIFRLTEVGRNEIRIAADPMAARMARRSAFQRRNSPLCLHQGIRHRTGAEFTLSETYQEHHAAQAVIGELRRRLSSLPQDETLHLATQCLRQRIEEFKFARVGVRRELVTDQQAGSSASSGEPLCPSRSTTKALTISLRS
jgi:hypothetical protein